MKTIQQQEQLTTLLNLVRQPVAVRFLKERHDYLQSPYPALGKRISYCVMVKLAGQGQKFTVNTENFRCLAGARALGLLAKDEFVSSGQHLNRHGIYENLAISCHVQQTITYLEPNYYGLEIAPLNQFTHTEPDVIIVICPAYAAMRLIQGYAYHSGVHQQIQMVGNQGICSECTALPFLNQSMNISLLCSGTRFLAKWENDEMGVGIAYSYLHRLIHGLIKTVNPIETNINKKRIYEQGSAIGIELPTQLSDNYFTRAFKQWGNKK